MVSAKERFHSALLCLIATICLTYAYMDCCILYPLDDYVTVVKCGYCVVFSNQNFDSLPTRTGTDKDVEELENVFRWLGFDFVSHIDLTKNEMQGALNGYMKRKYDQYDTLFCFVLTHGKDDNVLTTDGQEISFEVLKSVFVQSKGLHSKPKVVFIQACRGSDIPKFVQIVGHKESVKMDKKYCDFPVKPREVLSDSGSSIMQEEADFMMVLSSTAGTNTFDNLKYYHYHFIQIESRIIYCDNEHEQEK